MLLPTHTILGKLKLLETFYYYDGPKLFSCANIAGQHFLVFSLGEDDDEEYDRWLYVPMSTTRLNEVRSGAMTLRDACTNPEDEFVWMVDVPFKPNKRSNAQAANASNLTEDNLPAPSAKLELKTNTMPEILESIERHAERTNREVLDLAFQEENVNQSAIQASVLGMCLIDAQRLVEALHLADLNYKNFPNKLPEKVVKTTRLNAVGAFPGSFGIRLESTGDYHLFGATELQNVINNLLRIFEVADDHEKLKEVLEEIGGPVVGKLIKFCRSLGKNKVDMTATWGTPAQKESLRKVFVSWKDAEGTAQYLSRRIEDFTKDIEVSAVLIGANIKKRTFTVHVLNTDEELTGKIDESLIGYIRELKNARLSGSYKMTINMATEVNEVTGEPRYKYTLLNMEEI